MSNIFEGKDEKTIQRVKDFLGEEIIRFARKTIPAHSMGNLADNIYISERIIKKYMPKYMGRNSNIEPIEWNISALSRNPNISVEFIEENINLNWDFISIPRYVKLNIDFVIKYKEKFENISAYYISSNRGIGVNEMELFYEDGDYMTLWDQAGILENPSFDPYVDLSDYISDYIITADGTENYFSGKNLIPYKSVNDELNRHAWIGLSKNPNITIDFIRDYKDKLDFNLLSSNKAVKAEDIINNQDLRWTEAVINNPNVNLEVIKMYIPRKIRNDELFDIAKSQNIKPGELLSLDSLQKQNMNVIKKIYILNPNTSLSDIRQWKIRITDMRHNKLYGEIRKIFYTIDRVERIEDQFLECYYNPQYKFCRKRVMRQYEDIVKEFHMQISDPDPDCILEDVITSIRETSRKTGIHPKKVIKELKGSGEKCISLFYDYLVFFFKD